MGVNILELIVDLYLVTVIAAVIAFVLSFRRLDRYYRKRGLQAVFNGDSIVCLALCVVPVINLKYGLLYWNGSQFTDEELKQYLDSTGDDDYVD